MSLKTKQFSEIKKRALITEPTFSEFFVDFRNGERKL